ncbi:cadherin-like domain-containing protein [Pseudomaricurvus alcaniphilus]|uniref:cadherin-like domain-containing protein n=1 Tax=Pseudomaricurvus alcaniphilus TaxID=1166482 RepID=UPI00140E4CC5|nr:cadherin-like domain-containing protein [Pseudomaricurvus alcaniphilus]NHN38196.1 cadherin-like domain-containing protein [Pseudomaricurvus alcaniphilus]
MEQIYAILNAATAVEDQSLEVIVDQLGDLLGGNLAQQANKDDIELFYQELVAAGKSHSIASLVHADIASLATQDTEAGRGYRYALMNMQPFGVTSGLADTAAAGSAYDLDKFSEDYLYDRGAYLQARLQLNGVEGDGVAGTIPGAEAGLYIDMAEPDQKVWIADSEIRLNKSFPLGEDQQKQILLGAEEGENSLVGGDNHDRIYGQGGDDTLRGNGGDDYLEGGAGDDTYIFNSGDGHDSIYDLQGVNSLRIDDHQAVQLAAIGSAGSGQYREVDAEGIPVDDTVFSLTSAGLLVHVNGIGSGDTIELLGLEADSTDFELALASVAETVIEPIALIDTPLDTDTPYDLSQAMLTFAADYRIPQPSASHISGFNFQHLLQNAALEGYVSGASVEVNIDQMLQNMGYDSLGYDYHMAYYGSQNGFSDYELHTDIVYGRDAVGSEKEEFIATGLGDDIVYGQGGRDRIFAGFATQGSTYSDSTSFGSGGAEDYLAAISDDDYIDGGNDLDILFADAYMTYDSYRDDFYSAITEPNPELPNSGQKLRVKNLSEYYMAEPVDNGNDTVLGGANDGNTFGDLISSGGGDDFIFTGHAAGHNTVAAGAGNDAVVGSDGVDRIFADGVGVQVYNYSGSKFDGIDNPWRVAHQMLDYSVAMLDARYQNVDSLSYDDFVQAGAGNDFVAGEIGDDELRGEGGNDLLLGDRVNYAGMYSSVEQLTYFDLNSADHGNDRLFGGQGHDQLFGGGGADRLLGGAGNDHLWGDDSSVAIQFHGADHLEGGTGSDKLFGAAGEDTLLGGAGDDRMYGDILLDLTLVNGEIVSGAYDTSAHANDRLEGGAGDDFLQGDGGDDTLIGGAGDDTYYFDQGFGHDVISSDGNTTADQDVIRFARAISIASLTATQVENHLRLDVGPDSVTLRDFFAADFNAITVEFENGLVLNTDGLRALLGLDSEAQSDVFFDTSGNDSIVATIGNDSITLSSGADEVWAGNGDDTVYLSGSDQGVKKIRAGTGDDLLQGGEGDDTFTFNSLSAADSLETIDGGAGVNILSGTDANDSLDLSNTQLLNMAYVDAGAGADSLIGTRLNDHLRGGSGDDILNGLSGADTLVGGSGNDTYINPGSGQLTIDNYEADGSGVDVLVFQSVSRRADNTWFERRYDDLVIENVVVQDFFSADADYQLDQVQFADGSAVDKSQIIGWQVDKFAHIDAVADTYQMDAGATLVIATADLLANDFYRDDGGKTYGVEQWASIIDVSGSADAEVIWNDTDDTILVTPNAGFSGELTFSYDINDSYYGALGAVHIEVTGSSNIAPVAASDVFTAVGTQPISIAISELLANDSDADGEALEVTEVFNPVNGSAVLDAATATVLFTPAPDFISGAAAFDYTVSDGEDTAWATAALDILNLITGTSSREKLTGTSGDDYFVGGKGNDILLGAEGDDIFAVEGTGQGYDLIRGGEGFDTLLGGAGDDAFGLVRLLAADSLERIDGGAGENTLVGTRRDDRLDFRNTELLGITAIDGGGGDDIITGSRGDDLIIGHSGNDRLRGGDGDDRFEFGQGSGRDNVFLNVADSGQDSFVFTDTASDDLWFRRSDDHLVVNVLSSSDRVTFRSWFADGQQEQQILAADKQLNPGTLEQLISAMAAFDPPAGAGYVLPQDIRDELAPQLAVAWS